MSQLRRLVQNGALLGVTLLLAQCGGGDITLPNEAAPNDITIVGGDGQKGAAGSRLGKPLIVEVVNRSGDPVAGQRVAFAVNGEYAGAEVTSEDTTDAEGLASAEWILGAPLGTQEVTATVVGNEELRVTFQAAAESGQAQRLEYVSGRDQATEIGTALPDSLVVRATDQFGNPVAGIQVDWEAESGTVDPTSSVTGSDGQAATSWVLGISTGPHEARASSSGLTGSPVTFTGTAQPGTASRLVLVSGNNQSADPGQELSNPLVVRLVDEGGNGVPGRPVSWVVGVGGGSVSSLTSNTEGNGEAQVRWRLGSGTGLNTLNAVVSGVGVVAFRATASSSAGGGGGSAPGQLRFVVQPTNTGRKEEISPAVQVELLDQNGNRMIRDGIEIKLELSGNDDGKLKGNDKERTSSGLATFDDLEIDEEGTYRLRATADGVPAAESNAFEIHDDDDDGDDD